MTELESLSRSPASQMANAAVLSVGYDQEWKWPNAVHRLEAVFTLRSGVEALSSDLIYKRYFLTGRYRYERGRSEVLVSASTGAITPDDNRAPLFERFTLGDSTTLRGWNKYDIAPLGGDRMVETSLEYRNRGLAVFFDAGSVGDEGADIPFRTATGFGYHTDHVFITLGFPLNTDSVRAIFMAGVRF